MQILTNVVGCQELWEYPDPENIPLEMLDAIGVDAVSDTELIIWLIEPSASFLTKTTNPDPGGSAFLGNRKIWRCLDQSRADAQQWSLCDR